MANKSSNVALEFINEHPEIVYWSVFRWVEDEDSSDWREIDIVDIEEGELIDDFFFDGEGGCDVFLLE